VTKSEETGAVKWL